MNRNLRGEILSDEELLALANLDPEAATALQALHNPGLIRSELLTMTEPKRFAMFMAGELILDTNTDRRKRSHG
jgi:hypothetical protein